MSPDFPKIDNREPAPASPAPAPVDTMSPDTHHGRLEAALHFAPKPVTADQVLDIARGVLPSAQFGQFEKWMKSNATPLLERLNG